METTPSNASGPGEPIEQAREKTEEIQQTLEVASAELHLAATALDRNLPDNPHHEDVDRALVQNSVVERKVQAAAEELQEVADLLEQEVAQRGEARRPASRDVANQSG